MGREFCADRRLPLVVFDEVPESHSQHAGQLGQRHQADVELAPFKPRHERAVHVRGQRQGFLTDFPISADLSQTSADPALEWGGSRGRHERMLAVEQ